MDRTVEKIREFNRFYMPRVNLLGDHYLGSEYSVTQARVFFEIYNSEGCTASHIARTMNIDKSYLSRIIKRHEKGGYLYREKSTADGRAYKLFLTEKGKERAKDFIDKSNAEISDIIRNLSKGDKEQLIKSFDTIINVLSKNDKKIEIVTYDPKYKNDFIEMNKAWISEMFKIEPEDEKELSNIEPYIAKGGQIFFALDDNNSVAACCMIAPREDGDWEIMKFAARGMYTGTGAGSACLEACIEYARKKKIPKIIIVSNRKCTHAIHLYRKHGFKEIPVSKKKFHFERADIAFEKNL